MNFKRAFVVLPVRFPGRAAEFRLYNKEHALGHWDIRHLFADTPAQLSPADKAERNVRADLRCDPEQLRFGQRLSERSVQRFQDCRSVCAAAAHTSAAGNTLFDINADRAGSPRFFQEQLSGAESGVAAVRGDILPADGQRYAVPGADHNSHFIGKGNALHYGLKKVVAVVALSGNIEIQIQLCVCIQLIDPYPARGSHFLSSSTNSFMRWSAVVMCCTEYA